MSSSSLKLFGTTGLACGFRNTKKRFCTFSAESVVDDTRLELVTSRTSSGCATSCANRLLREKTPDFTGFYCSYLGNYPPQKPLFQCKSIIT